MPAPVTGGSVSAGNVSFSSSDASLAIDGGPAQGQIDLRAGDGMPRVFTSLVVDFSSNGVQLWGPDWPTRPGFALLPLQVRIHVTALAGAFAAQSPVGSINGPLGDNVMQGTTIPAANLNSMVALGTAKNASISWTATPRADRAMSELTGWTPSITMTTLALGTFRGRVIVMGVFVPYSP